MNRISTQSGCKTTLDKIPEARRKASCKIQSDIDAFLAKGGAIDVRHSSPDVNYVSDMRGE